MDIAERIINQHQRESIMDDKNEQLNEYKLKSPDLAKVCEEFKNLGDDAEILYLKLTSLLSNNGL